MTMKSNLHKDNLRDIERRYADISNGEQVIEQFETWRKKNTF